MMDVREHLTEGVTRARLGLESRRAVRPGLVTLAGIAVGLVLAGYIASNVSRTFLSATEELRFHVSDANGVLAGSNEVRYKGVVAGTITKLDVTGGQPVITVKIKKKFGPFYSDLRARLRPNTPLQDMYLDIVDRGTKSAGLASYDRPIGPEQTAVGVSINDVLGVFRAPERAALGTLIDQLGNGMADRGARLRALLVELEPLLDAARSATQQLDGRRAMVKRLVHNIGLLTTELADDEAALTRLVRRGSETVATVEDGSSDLSSLLRELPPTLSTATSSFTDVRAVLDDVDEALRSVRPVVDKLPAALDDIERLSDAANPAVNALQTPIAKLAPLVEQLKPVSERLDSALAALEPQDPAIDKTSRGLASCILPLQRFFQWNASFTKYGDVRAPSPRGEIVLGLQSTGATASPFESAPKSCTGGTPIGGRPATDADGR